MYPDANCLIGDKYAITREEVDTNGPDACFFDNRLR